MKIEVTIRTLVRDGRKKVVSGEKVGPFVEKMMQPQFHIQNLNITLPTPDVGRPATKWDTAMKQFFVTQCYEKSKRIDGAMTWEVGEAKSRNRVCLCYSKEVAHKIAAALEQPLIRQHPTTRKS